MAEKTYNGWTNYETWNVALWIGNEEGSYRHWELNQAEECYQEAVEADQEGNREEWTGAAVRELADRLKSEFVDNAPEVAGCYGDLLTAALSEVNWYEIATSYVGNMDKDAIESSVLPEPEEEETADDEEDEEDAEATAE